jgi:hypothetical protein
MDHFVYCRAWRPEGVVGTRVAGGAGAAVIAESVACQITKVSFE